MNDLLAIASQCARDGGELITQMRADMRISHKASNNLVTQADLAAQNLIIDRLRSFFPTHSFLAEENDITAVHDSADLWIIDPLDGTNNYAHGVPQYSVCVAHATGGVVDTAVVFDPLRNELFSASATEPARLNGEPITVSSPRSLADCIVATGFYYGRGKLIQDTLGTIGKLFENNIQGIRRFGSAALDLCWVGCGRFDAYFEYQLGTWDYAAAGYIAQRAGARLFATDLSALTLTSCNCAAATPAIFDTFSKIIRRNKT